MDILVVGGTTFFGRDIVELTLEDGHRVTVFSRGNQRPEFWERIEHIAGDRADQADFGKKLARRQFDVVVDNIAFNSDNVSNVIDTLAGNIGRYILTSTTAVYIGVGDFDMPVAENDVNLDPGDDPQFPAFPKPTPEGVIGYALGKLQAEKVLFEQDIVPYTIIRPPNVMGPEDPTGRCQFYFQRLLDGKPLILTNGGVQSAQPVYRRDLARAYVLAMGNEKAVNQVYNIAQNKTARLVDWVRLAADLLGVEANPVSIPGEVLQKAGFEYAESYTYIGTFTLDVAKARTDLGYTSTSVASWLATTTQWYQDTQHEADSPGYGDRQKEIEFAERYLNAVGKITS